MQLVQLHLRVLLQLWMRSRPCVAHSVHVHPLRRKGERMELHARTPPQVPKHHHCRTLALHRRVGDVVAAAVAPTSRLR